MRHTYLAFAFAFLFPFLGKSQDTIRVQTFTWDSETRSDVFQFPDNPSNSYRKIWMKYNMRCHDNAVGSGNVGCREWDYSCNTFLYDPDRVDSTRQTAPTHIISNFSGDVFDYTTQPVYTYTQYEQHEPSVSILNETSASVGNGIIPLELAGTQSVARSQFLFTADELSSAGLVAGEIHALELMVAQTGFVEFFRIRMKATTKSELNPQNPDTEDFTEVIFNTLQLNTIGAQRLDFYQPFDWDGTSNILVDMSFTQNPVGSFPAIQAHDSGFSSMIAVGAEDYSLLFTGAEQVDVPSEKFSTVSDQITISMWANGTPEIMPANSTVFEGKDAANNRQVNVHLPWGNGQVYWDCGNDGGGYDRINKQASDADYEGQWNHWAFTKNATTGSMKIYLNGQLWHSGTGLTKPIDVAEFAIGASVTGGSKYYGKVDEFRVWDVELDEATIAEWMRKSVDGTHPSVGNLVAYFQMNEGTGFNVNDYVGGAPATTNLPNWQRQRGKDLYKNFFGASFRPNASFIQGEATIDDQIVTVLDSTLAPQHSVTFNGLDGTDLIVTDLQYYFGAGYTYIYDENGQVIDSVAVAPEGSIEIGELTHYTKADGKFELLSLVTPYGNGLGLGSAGKTFWFDVTHFAPVLKGEKRIPSRWAANGKRNLTSNSFSSRAPRPVTRLKSSTSGLSVGAGSLTSRATAFSSHAWFRFCRMANISNSTLPSRATAKMGNLFPETTTSMWMAALRISPMTFGKNVPTTPSTHRAVLGFLTGPDGAPERRPTSTNLTSPTSSRQVAKRKSTME